VLDLIQGEGKKRDVKQLVAVIPPASQILSKGGGKSKERRIRLRLKPNVDSKELYLSPQLLKELNIKKEVEISVAGKKRLRFKAVENEEVPPNEVWGNEGFLKERGIADNSLVTVRGV